MFFHVVDFCHKTKEDLRFGSEQCTEFVHADF